MFEHDIDGVDRNSSKQASKKSNCGKRREEREKRKCEWSSNVPRNRHINAKIF